MRVARAKWASWRRHGTTAGAADAAVTAGRAGGLRCHARAPPASASAAVSSTELVALVCCDLGAIVRGRAVFASELDKSWQAGVGWVPANHSLTPHGPLAEHTPFGSTGDLRLLPDPDTHVRVEGNAGASALEFVLCDIVETDGQPWECCPRRFLRERPGGARARVRRPREGELRARVPAPRRHARHALPFSLEALRRAEPFAADAMAALDEAGAQPERFFPEFAAHQFEVPVAAAEGLAAADRAVVLREVVREVARRHGMTRQLRATD